MSDNTVWNVSETANVYITGVVSGVSGVASSVTHGVGDVVHSVTSGKILLLRYMKLKGCVLCVVIDMRIFLFGYICAACYSMLYIYQCNMYVHHLNVGY